MSNTSTHRNTTNSTEAPRVSLLTPPGAGAIAVIRLTGEKSARLLLSFLRGSDGSPIPQSAIHNPQSEGRIRRAVFHDGPEALDDVLVIAGTDPIADGCVDICAHGGVRVVERIIAALVRGGARFCPSDQARAEAWPAANLIEAEAWSALSHAQTRRAARWLLAARQALPAELRRIAGVGRNEADRARQSVQELIDRSPACRHLVEGATVAIIGPANAGKSTLANRLLGAERILVSPRAGTTLDWVDECAAIDGVPVILVDTPGYGPHGRELDATAIERAARRILNADLVLLVFDGSLPPPAGRLDQSPQRKQGNILVLNKRDLGMAWSGEQIRAVGGPAGIVEVSASEGTGIDDQRTRIIAQLGLDGPDNRLLGFFTERQRRLAETMLLFGDGEKLAAAIWEDLLGEKLAD